ncbi:hypothetical protein TcCL_NonESM03184 [Trypanosoma cruzi]|nr:hypothetical protein TcCL_NonESM03184 [Trypanosoma cruzi]
MSDEVQFFLSLKDELPLLILRKSGQTIAVTRDEPSVGSILPFSPRVCDLVRVSDEDVLRKTYEDGYFTAVARNWRIKAKVNVSLDPIEERTHWLLFLGRNKGTAEKSKTTVAKSFKGTEKDLREVVNWLKSLSVEGYCEVYLASEPSISDLRVTGEVGRLCLCRGDERVNEQVFFGDSMDEIAICFEELLSVFFFDCVREAKAVFWPPSLTHPLNIHYGAREMRVAEHNAALLPKRPLLHLGQRYKEWPMTINLPTVLAASVPRTGQSWEKNLICNIHAHLSTNSFINGGEKSVVSGAYDYYHYRVDGFKDDGWGCAYRSLQTILSWFQHEGYMNEPMPDICAIQNILYAKDPDKMNRKEFIGSKEWIGSFEVMIVIQHFLPGMDCMIRRMESGSDLETDPSVQQTLVNHFRQKRACPVMIGGSSYAHTILGVDANLATMEARYLVADPHYSSGETSLKTVVKKGYVGWKEAGKFFESNSWYNLCIPQLATYDPR